MRPSEVLEKNRKLIRKTVLRCHTRNPRVFGSVLYGTDTEESDLDLLVDGIKGKTSLFDLGGLEYELQEQLGIPVHVTTPEELNPRFRDRVLKEACPI